MRLYIAGPMTGIPQFNIPAFDAATAGLRMLGHEVISPAELDDPRIREISLASPDGDINTIETHGATWGDFLSRDVKVMADTPLDAVVVLPGWEHSRGARLETFVANALRDLPVLAAEPCECPSGIDLSLVARATLTRAWIGEDFSMVLVNLGLWSKGRAMAEMGMDL